ncbi:MAG TPA: MBL fold metallo-hydrolase [Candidatus Acetothermia bacterium]|nr:MBL fold metallo-hydrolase [Candidatus Acetothermia bacterium]
MPQDLPLTEVHRGVWLLDADQFGVPGQGGVYIVCGEPAALVDAGTSLARERVLAALDRLEIAHDEVAWIFLTHIHLDHAGGAGTLLRELPAAQVVVHARGARHLVDPSRLVASVRDAVRERFPLYGTMDPIPADRLHVAQDGEAFPLGRFRIRALDAPGHAPHHLCFFAEGVRLLFTGDAVGLYLDGVLLPSTVPPSFDLGLSLSTLDRLIGLDPEVLLFTHFGPGSPALLSRYAELLRTWVERVGRLRGTCRNENELVRNVVAEAAREGLVPPGPAWGDLAMSVRGAAAYLSRREGAT